MQETQETKVQSLGREDPLEEDLLQPSPVFLSGESPWTEEPGGLQPMGLQRVRHIGSGLACTLTFQSRSFDPVHQDRFSVLVFPGDCVG